MNTTRLIVKQLPKYLQDKQLKQHIENAGFSLSDCRILKTPDGKSRRFAFIGFSTEEEAQKALEFFHSTYLHTSQIFVEKALPPGSKDLERPWSKYSKGSSGYENRNQNNEHDKNSDDKSYSQNSNSNKSHSSLNNSLDISQHINDTNFITNCKNKENFITTKTNTVNPTKAGMSSLRHYTIFEDKDDENFTNSTMTEKIDNKNESAINDNINLDLSKDTIILDNNLDDLEWLKSKSGLIEDESCSNNNTAITKISPQEVLDSSENSSNNIDDLKKLTSDSFITKKFSQEMIESSENLTNNADDLKNVNTNIHLQISNNQFQMDNISETRLMVLNIPYNTTEADLRSFFSVYGEIDEIVIPIDEGTGKLKGFAFVSFIFSTHAESALKKENNKIFMGRLLIIKPASEKPIYQDYNNNNFLKSSFKKKKFDLLKQNAEDQKTWNLLFVSANASVNVISQQLAVDKSEILDMESDRMAVNVALGETYLIQQTKQWLKSEGLNLEAFERDQNHWLDSGKPSSIPRSSEAIIVKHLPSTGYNDSELIDLFASVGTLVRFTISPSRLVAIIRYIDSQTAKKAFSKFSFKRFHSVPLYLEWAPDDLFSENSTSTVDIFDSQNKNNELVSTYYIDNHNNQIKSDNSNLPNLSNKLNKTDTNISNHQCSSKLDSSNIESISNTKSYDTNYNISTSSKSHLDIDENFLQSTVSLFVKNLSFETTDSDFKSLFEDCSGFHTCKIMRKKKALNNTSSTKDNSNSEKNNNQDDKDQFNSKELSMGYGFVEFDCLENAQKALQQYNSYTLDGHSLNISISQRKSQLTPSINDSSSNPLNSQQKISKKLIVKNMPFEASRKELNQLFSAYGNVTAIRLPKKVDGTNRGYAFVEFLTTAEATHALQALQHTHFYGRHLIIHHSIDISGENVAQQAIKKAIDDQMLLTKAKKKQKTLKLIS